MGSGSPSPTRRMRWEGSKGTVGAGDVHFLLAEDGNPRVVGGGPRFLITFCFLRLSIIGIFHSSTGVKSFGRDNQIAHHFSIVHNICIYVLRHWPNSAYGKIFGRNDLTLVRNLFL